MRRLRAVTLLLLVSSITAPYVAVVELWFPKVGFFKLCAYVVANGTEDQEELLISSTSKLCSEAIDLRQFEQGRVLGRGQARNPDHSADVQVLLLFAPNIHLCTFDGLTISLPSLGHWLHVHDTKGELTCTVKQPQGMEYGFK